MGDMISSLLFQPPPPTRLKEEKLVWLKTRRGKRIPAFFVDASKWSVTRIDCQDRTRRDQRAQYRNSNSPPITILYSHANAEDLGNIYPWCKFLAKSLQVNIFAYDYTGYGLATEEGTPTEEDCCADIEAAYQYLRHDLSIPTEQIVLYGRSLGSGPSCHLAAKIALEAQADESNERLGGLILHAPFLSVFRVVFESGCTLIGDKFPNIDLAPYIRTSVLLIHGTEDMVVPVGHSQELLDAIDESYRTTPLFIKGMGHNNVHTAVRAVFIDRIREYLLHNVRSHLKETKKYDRKYRFSSSRFGARLAPPRNQIAVDA